jgi:hypothetical protein
MSELIPEPDSTGGEKKKIKIIIKITRVLQIAYINQSIRVY